MSTPAHTLNDEELRLLMAEMTEAERARYIRAQIYAQKGRCHRILLLDDCGVGPTLAQLQEQRAARAARKAAQVADKKRLQQAQAESRLEQRRAEALRMLPQAKTQYDRVGHKTDLALRELHSKLFAEVSFLARRRETPTPTPSSSSTPWERRYAAAVVAANRGALGREPVGTMGVKYDLINNIVGDALAVAAAAASSGSPPEVRLRNYWEATQKMKEAGAMVAQELRSYSALWLDEEQLLRRCCLHAAGRSCDCPSTPEEVKRHVVLFVRDPLWRETLGPYGHARLVDAAERVESSYDSVPSDSSED